MRILFDNVLFSSRSGPNSFGLKLARALSILGHTIVEPHERPDVQLSFIQAMNRVAPIVQRIDGVWFNQAQDWRALNAPILQTFRDAEHVIVQSEFDKRLVKRFLGDRDMTVIHNGTDVGAIASLDPLHVPGLMEVEKVWSCASSWRPHKRLAENVRYFLEHAGKNDCLVIAGANPDIVVADPRVFYAGDLETTMLHQLYRSSDYFLHLAWLDHCPNVVVDARAAGCHIICASSGGTHEVAGENATVIVEDDWDFEPCMLYEPPRLDFTRVRAGILGASIDIDEVAVAYAEVLGRVKR